MASISSRQRRSPKSCHVAFAIRAVILLAGAHFDDASSFEPRGVEPKQQPSHQHLIHDADHHKYPLASSSAPKYPEDWIRDLQNLPRSRCRKVNGSRKTQIPCRIVRKLSMRLKSWSTSAEVRSAPRYWLGIRHGGHQDTADAGCRLRCQIGNPGQRDDKM